VSRLRRNLVWSGLAGLLACGLLALLAVWLAKDGVIKALLPYPAIILLLVLVFGAFSVAEIPMMVFAMRRLLVERRASVSHKRRGNEGFVLGMNALFVFFAAVYGAPVLVLTGSLGWGLALCALGIVRLAASLIFVIPPQAKDPPGDRNT
jgi:hypothetical protein